MIEFSFGNFITTLINIITDSPTSILFIILGIIFTVAMIINVKKNKTIGKTLFIIGWIFIILFIIIKYNGYISKLFDNLINNVFMQIFFPNLATYIIIIIITNIIFLKTILNKKTKPSSKIVNSLAFSLIMVLMVYTLDLIIENKINIYEKSQLYTNKQVLTLIEATTIIFTFWIIIILSKKLIIKLINKSNEKIIKENKPAIKENITDTVNPIPVEPAPTENQNMNQMPIEINTDTVNPIPIEPAPTENQNINQMPIEINTDTVNPIPVEPAPTENQNINQNINQNSALDIFNVPIENETVKEKIEVLSLDEK